MRRSSSSKSSYGRKNKNKNKNSNEELFFSSCYAHNIHIYFLDFLRIEGKSLKNLQMKLRSKDIIDFW